MAVALILLLSSLFFPAPGLAQEAVTPAVAELKPAAAATAPEVAPPWQEPLETAVQEIERAFPGRIGVLAEDLSGGGEYRHRAGEKYYLASVIKMLVMIEFFHQLDQGTLFREETITLTRQMFRDGAGQTSFFPPGKRLTLDWLLNEMMLESDNAATDILFHRLGVERVNQMKDELGLTDMGPLITMLEVRRRVYSHLDPRAMQLTGNDYIALWRKKQVKDKLPLFARLIGESRKVFTPLQYDRAFADFYRSGTNSAALIDLARLLRLLLRGQVLSPELSRQMMELMERCQTGQERVKAGLPPGWKYAHKTGTQHEVICDAGIATRPSGGKIILAICLDRFPSRSQAEKTMAQLARTVVRHLPPDPFEEYLHQPPPETLCREENPDQDWLTSVAWEPEPATSGDSATSADETWPAPTAIAPDAPSSFQ